MFIEKLNQYTEEQIIGLKNEDNKLRLLIEEQPDIEKLKLLKEAIINETTEVTLVMRSNNNNLIAFSYFECISDNIIGVESYNYTENILKTIEGISIFRNLRSIVIDAPRQMSAKIIFYMIINSVLTNLFHWRNWKNSV